MEINDRPTRMTRRSLLKFAGVSALGAALLPVLAACGGNQAARSSPAPGTSSAAPASSSSGRAAASSAGAAASSSAAPKAATQVVVRANGGAYQHGEEEAIYKPFTAATGIKVVTATSTAAQILAYAE
ncbi:MAG: hypothetical protein KGJ86_10615, partial [Chloroflexota bacterium]|nr:hypothetical protein [Chloroflexota bacterium]